MSFPLDDEPSVSVIAWTTTPWTLPSNLSLCVHPEFNYVKVKGDVLYALCVCVMCVLCAEGVSGRVYLLLEERLSALFKSEQEYTILDKMQGKQLCGMKYEPLFPYYQGLKSTEPGQGAFRIVR